MTFPLLHFPSLRPAPAFSTLAFFSAPVEKGNGISPLATAETERWVLWVRQWLMITPLISIIIIILRKVFGWCRNESTQRILFMQCILDLSNGRIRQRQQWGSDISRSATEPSVQLDLVFYLLTYLFVHLLTAHTAIICRWLRIARRSVVVLIRQSYILSCSSGRKFMHETPIAVRLLFSACTGWLPKKN